MTNDSGGEGGTIFTMDTNGNLQSSYTLTTNNGLRPLGALAVGSNGNLYGCTSLGGAGGFGSVFVFTAGGISSNLYSFTGGADGGYPRAGLVQGSDGEFYGTTTQGGNLALNAGQGFGTIFKITTNGVLTALYNFDITNGAWAEVSVLGGLVVQPEGGLILARDGNFYGMATTGGRLAMGMMARMNFRRFTGRFIN